MGIIETYLAGSLAKWAIGIIGGTLLAWALKSIPNEKIKLTVGKFGYHIGSASTLWLSKWKFTAGFWNKTIEPWFIDLVDNVVGEFVKEFIRGLRSDNSADK